MTPAKGQAVHYRTDSNTGPHVGTVLKVEGDALHVRTDTGRKLWIDTSSLVDESWRPRDAYA